MLAAAETKTIVTRGGVRLHGRVGIDGAKNAALPAMAAALLTEEECLLDNVPVLEDVLVMIELLRRLGAEVEFDQPNHRLRICAAPVHDHNAPPELVERMRASFLVSGPLLSRLGRAGSTAPGGCKLGTRPVDVDLRPAFAEHDRPPTDLADGDVGVVAGRRQEAAEPVAERAAGTPHIRVQGVDRLRGYRAAILPDRIEAGTIAIAAAISNGEVVLDHVSEPDMLPLTSKLREAGAEVWWSGDSMLVRGSGRLEATEIQALPFPGFPTDLQAAFAVLMTQAHGTSQIYERVFNDRLRYVEELCRMGADICLKDKQHAVIEGPTALHGSVVSALDIRSGASLVLAGLVAEGETQILETQHLRRGYEDIVGKFARLGADISYV